MRTSVIELTRNDKKVILVGACHVAKKEYFRELREILYSHNNVLYEMVKGPKRKKNYIVNGIEIMAMFKDDIVSQKEEIDYKREGWENSDLHIDELLLFNPSLKNRLEKIENLNIKEIGNITFLGKILANILLSEPVMLLLQKYKPDYAILDMRNHKVLYDIFKVLKEENEVCVFYGEGHLKGLVYSLKKLGFKINSKRKIRCW